MDEKEVSEMQEEMMKVLVVEPMKAPYVKSIPNELEDLQQAVGGDIEMTYPFEDEVGILLNGNGKFESGTDTRFLTGAAVKSGIVR